MSQPSGGEVIAKAIAESDETYKLFEPFKPRYTGGPLGPLTAQAIYYSWEIRDRIKEWKIKATGEADKKAA